jgi:hypothetical protein
MFDGASAWQERRAAETKVAKPSPKAALLGSLQPEYVRCGTPTCRCARGELHGPYWRRYYWRDGRRCREYVRLAEHAEVAAAIVAGQSDRALRRGERQRVRELAGRIRQLRALMADLLGR